MLIKRFMDKVEITDSCWIWKGAKSKNGYGVFTENSKPVSAHRYAFKETKGEIGEGLIILHTCDNPACVNPEHLKMGTYKENTLDMFNKGRSNVPRGERHASIKNPESVIRGENHSFSKLTWDDVLEIRRVAENGNEIKGSEFSQSKLAEKYGVSHITIHDVVHYVTWKKQR